VAGFYPAVDTLYAQNIDIYVAPTWDSGDTWLATMQHIARESGAWVIGCATALEASDTLHHSSIAQAVSTAHRRAKSRDSFLANPSLRGAAGFTYAAWLLLFPGQTGQPAPAKPSDPVEPTGSASKSQCQNRMQLGPAQGYLPARHAPPPA